MTKIINVPLAGDAVAVDLADTPAEIYSEETGAAAVKPEDHALLLEAPGLQDSSVSIASNAQSKNPDIGRAEILRKHCIISPAKAFQRDALQLPVRYRIVPWAQNPPEIRGKGKSALLSSTGLSPLEMEFIGIAAAPFESARRLEVGASGGWLQLYPKPEKNVRRRLITAAIAVRRGTREPLIAAISE